MKTFEKPIVVMSKCLGLEACRYDGAVIRDSWIEKLMSYVHIIPVCPEVEIGLGTPRSPIRLVLTEEKKKLMQPSTNLEFTEEMNSFALHFLSSLPPVDGFILKNRSPSCAISDAKLYRNELKSSPVGKTAGLFGEQVKEKFSHLAIEDEGRLKNFTVRDHFLMKLFTLASFRKVKANGSPAHLITFHSKNKYLFMAFHPGKLKELGRIVANVSHHSINEVISEYERVLCDLLSRPYSLGANVNVFYHIMGYFKKVVSREEKTYFLTMLEQFQQGKVPKVSILTMLYAWAIRFEQDYLLKQTFFHPYPDSLLELTDSGKGRNLA